MKPESVLLFVILLIGTISCEKEKEIPQELDAFTISYVKGSSWVKYSYDVTINQNGLIKVIEKNQTNTQYRESKYYASGNDLILIKEKLNNLLNIDISDKYGFNTKHNPTDVPIIKLVYKTVTKSDSTSIYFLGDNEIPAELDSYLKTIENIISNKDTLSNSITKFIGINKVRLPVRK